MSITITKCMKIKKALIIFQYEEGVSDENGEGLVDAVFCKKGDCSWDDLYKGIASAVNSDNFQIANCVVGDKTASGQVVKAVKAYFKEAE